MFLNWKKTSGNSDPKISRSSRRGKSLGLKMFGRNEDGSLIVFSLFIFLMMLMVGGLAVDVI